MEKTGPIVEKVIVYAFIALLLGMLSPFDNGGGYFFDSRAIFYLAAILLGALYCLAWIWGGFEYNRAGPGLLFLLFYVVALFSVYHLYNVRASLDSLILFLSYFAIFLLTANLITTETSLRSGFITLVTAGTILSFYGIYQYLFGFRYLRELVSTQQIDISTPNRVFAIFTSPNVFAGLLVMLIPLALTLFLTAGARPGKFLSGLAVVSMVESVFLTASRGGLLSLGLLVGILLLGFWKIKELKLFLINFAFFGLLTGLTHLLLNRIAADLAAGTIHKALEVTGAVSSAAGRFDLWQGTLNMIRSFPFIGSGIGTFAGLYPRFQAGSIYSKFAHNTYLQITAETGIVGGLLFLAIIGYLWWKPLRTFLNSAGRHQLYSLALFSALSVAVLRNLVDYDCLIPAAGMTFWFLAGLTFSPALAGLGRDRKIVSLKSWSERTKVYASLAVSAVAVLLLVLVILAFTGYLYREQASRDFKKRRYAAAAETLEKAVSFDPLAAQYRHELALNYQLIWNASGGANWIPLFKAIESEKKAVALEPEWAGFHKQLGILYSLSGENVLALKELKLAEKLYPNHPGYKVALGRFYLDNKQPKLAVSKLKEAIKLPYYQRLISSGKIKHGAFDRSDPAIAIEDAYVLLGEAYMDLDRPDKALEIYSDLVDYSPENVTAYLGRGWIYLKVKKDSKKALSDFKQAVKLEPNLFYGYYYLGITYGERGEQEQAAKAFKKALKIDPGMKREIEAELEKLQPEGCN